MIQDQKQLLKNLQNEQRELENAVIKLQQDLESRKNQYLKITGAVDVLSMIVKEDTETEVTEQE